MTPEPTVVGTVVLDAHGTAIQLRDWYGYGTSEDRYWAWAGTDITGTWGDVAQPAVVIHEPSTETED